MVYTTKRSPSLQIFMIATTTANRRSDAFESFKYDPRSRRFRIRESSGRGRFITKQAFDFQLAKYIEQQQQGLVDLADDISGGAIDLPTFQRKAAGFLKEIHTSIILQNVEKLQREDNEIVQRILLQQFHAGRDEITGEKYGLMHLARQIRDGEVSPQQLRHRMRLYSLSAKQTYDAVDRNIQKRSGMTVARRVLADSDRSCPECVSYSIKGWVDIDKVQPIATGCSCRVRCRCRIEYRKSLPKSEQRKRELEAIDRLVKGRKRG